MLKSTRLILTFGTLLGLSVAFLPQASRATTITQDEVNVSATINGILSLEAIAHANGTATYSSAENKYSATMNAGSGTENFGMTTYRVTCNYLIENETDCSNGWKVTAASGTDDNSYATMVGSTGNTFKIQSVKANGLTGANANWLMKISNVTGNVNAIVPFSDNTLGRNYNNFDIIPITSDTNKTVVTGNTFTVSSGTKTYNGTQSFNVTYGLSAGTSSVADTYTGSITYTLSLNAS